MSVNAGTSLVACRASQVAVTSSCPIIAISSIEHAQVFVDQVRVGIRSGTRIQDLVVSLSGLPAFHEADIAPILASLCLVPNLTDLTLLLPANSPPVLLADVNFNGLQFFRSNLPHGALSAFLGHHRSLSVLVLGPCGSARWCPLLEVDFACVTDLECNAECVCLLVRNDLFHLASHKSAGGLRIGVIFRTSPVCVTGLYSLTIDFFPDDIDVLDNLSLFAPLLRKLKLLEQRGVTVRCDQSRHRPFNDTLAWARTLRKLPHLEELSLQTSVGLIRHPRDYFLEHSLVMGWVYGLRTRALRHPPPSFKAHPSLYHIRIWYGARGNDSALSKWFKEDEEWHRLGEPLVGEDLNDVDF